MDTDFDYCRTQAEKHDRDRYIASLAAPASARPALWAILAFNHEIAKTRETVRDAHAGHLRLAWWRERLDQFYAGGEMPAHEVARALGSAIQQYKLNKNHFDALLDARGTDLDGTVPASLDGLADYATVTNAPLLALCGQVFGKPGDDHLAAAWGLTGIIRALPFSARENRCYLPLPMMHEIGLMPEQFHHLKSSPALSAQIALIAQRARENLNGVRNDAPFFQRLKTLNEIYLKRIEKGGHDPFSPLVFGPVPFLGLRVLF